MHRPRRWSKWCLDPATQFFNSVLSVWYDVANREQSRAGIDANLSQVESGYQDCLLIGMPMLTGPYGTGEIKEYVIFEVIAPQLTYTYAFTNETEKQDEFPRNFPQNCSHQSPPKPNVSFRGSAVAQKSQF